jgi:hypothetical protein
MFTAVENTPISVNLTQQAISTGWSIDPVSNIATHETCNSGNIRLVSYNIVSGQTYQVSYSILSISAGFIQLNAGISVGVSRTTAGSYVETITATGVNPTLYFYSNANCQIIAFNIQNTVVDTSNYQQNTIVYSVKTERGGTNKWGEFRTIAPDYGFSLGIDMFTVYKGALYVHQNGSASRNNFYGIQYQSIIKFVETNSTVTVQDFETFNYQANMLLVTTINGVTTSLGQVSSLIDTDFIKQSLTSNGVTVIDYQKDSIYSASFLNDENDDIVNGEQLRGNYIIIEIITVDGSKPLVLFSVEVKSRYVPLGAR